MRERLVLLNTSHPNVRDWLEYIGYEIDVSEPFIVKWGGCYWQGAPKGYKGNTLLTDDEILPVEDPLINLEELI